LSAPMAVAEAPMALFQPNGQPCTTEGQPMVVTLSRAGKLLIIFAGMAYLRSANDETAARYRFVLLVDDQPVGPATSGITLAPSRTGSSLSMTVMVALAAGTHTVQVAAQATTGAVYATDCQSLTAMGPLE
jgi:transcriptional regulator GlxA family with amidase domain